MVWKRAPARLCSSGNDTFATNNAPVAYTKSAPMTATVVAGKPKAQYGAEGLMSANKRHAVVEPRVPVTAEGESKEGGECELAEGEIRGKAFED